MELGLHEIWPTILDNKYLLVFVNVLSGLVEAYSIGTDYSNSY